MGATVQEPDDDYAEHDHGEESGQHGAQQEEDGGSGDGVSRALLRRGQERFPTSS